ncbi:MAG: glycerol-3-phosphate 1-O-acyltransferase PlsY [Gammaproteobacteria bacterium]|jgi:acyl phosphate:glycerol-3-phosphate acyltransferase|nr:glycerol-3-phosphate 1-O-acyltransferase PlsY [Gammaproteobacteria bacterium]
MLIPASLVVVAYLMGSVSTAVLVCRALGVADPREVGSRNPGATNVLRHAGKGAAAVTLLGDAAKGLVPVLIGHALGLEFTWLAAVGLAAFLGHLYPVFYGFVGGKGVATFIGVTLALDWRLGANFVGVWLAMAFALRWSSLAALVATASMPLVAWRLGAPSAAVGLVVAMCALVYWRHRGNIQNLLNGTEKKIGQKA